MGGWKGGEGGKGGVRDERFEFGVEEGDVLGGGGGGGGIC